MFQFVLVRHYRWHDSSAQALSISTKQLMLLKTIMVIIKAHEGVINQGGTSSGQNMAGGI